MMLSFLIISLLINLFLIWFGYKLLIRQSEIVVLTQDIKYKINLFKNHINNIHELPMFYGEPTLQNLITHSKELVDSFDNFEQDYLLLTDGEEEDDI